MTRDSVFLTEISGDAGLRHAQDIAAQLKTALAEHDTVIVTTNGITTADITTVQLLLAARKQALATGKSLLLAAPPQGVLREFLIQTGFLDGSGNALTPDDGFWVSEPQTDKGKAA